MHVQNFLASLVVVTEGSVFLGSLLPTTFNLKEEAAVLGHINGLLCINIENSGVVLPTNIANKVC